MRTLSQYCDVHSETLGLRLRRTQTRVYEGTQTGQSCLYTYIDVYAISSSLRK